LENTIDPMKEVLDEYSDIVYDYNMKSNRTLREGFGSVNF